eukprot:403367017
MYGCDNQNSPKGFAVRDMSYLEMALHPNDILFYSRIQFKMGNYTGMQYVGLKDGENSWIYDVFNENYVNHIKSKDNNNKDLYWTYEPFPPVICHGDYQTMDPDRLLCQDIASLYLQDTMTNQLLFQNVPLDPIITDQTEFTFLFFAQILFVQENKKHHIYQFNPTALSDSDKLIMFYESQILPDSSIANYMRHAFHEQPTFSIATDFNVWNLYGLRCTINGYIINFDRYTYSQTQNNINRPTTSYLFDKQLQIGGQYLYQTNNLTNPKMKIRDIMFLPNVVLTDYLVLQFQYKKMNRIGPYSVPFHYPLTENSLIQLQYNKGITDSIEYQMFVLNSYPGIESFYISDTFNYDRSVKFYRYAGSNKMFSNFQPSQQIDDWTFQFYAMISADQPVSKNIFLHSSWLKINTIQSNQTYQLIFLPHLTTQTYSLFTAETFQLNQWVYTTITYKHSENQLDFYKDGLQLNQLEGGEPIPTDLAHLLLDSGKFIWIPTFHYDSANMDLTSFCSQDQVFDGLSCQTFKYLWLKTDEVSDLMLPILNLKTNPQEFTLEFWFLLVKNQRLGNIFQLQLDSGTDLQYICLIEPTTLDLFKLINCDNDGHIIPNSATTILNYDQNVDYLLNRPNLIYKLQNWHKFSLIFESSDNSLTAFIDLQQMTNQIFLTTIAAQTLSKMKEMKFCFSNQFYQLLIPIRSQFGQTFIKYPQLMELQLFVGLDQLKMIKENNVNYNRGLVKWKFIEYFQFLAYLCKMVPLCYNKSWKQQISFGFQRFSSIKQWHFKLNDWTFKWVQLSFRMLYGLYPNHPGLVKYYKFNDERILELVSNRENRVSSGQNLISSSDDTFDFSCPAGYSFQDNLNDCMFGFSYTQINNYGWLKMNYKNYLEPLIKEQDYTFTFLTTVATGASYTGNFFNNLDLFKVISVNKTSYQTSYKWGSQYSSPISSNAGMYWFFNYDVSRGVFSYYVGTTLISQSQFKSTEMPDFENYIMRFGSETSTVDVYLKNFQIFYPQLTIVEISKIVNGQGNQFKYKSGLISMFETQYNKYTVLYDYDAHPYDMIGETWDTLQSYEQAPTQIRQTTGWNVCPFNFISKSYYCYPYSSLLIQQGKLELNTAALKIGYSATILFDFTVLKFPTAPSSPIILMHLVQVVIVHILNQQLFVQCLSPNINVANQVFYTQQTHSEELYDSSYYQRKTVIATYVTTIGWDYEYQQASGRDMRKTSENSYIVKDKALYSGHQQANIGTTPVTNQLKIGQISKEINGQYTISFCYMLISPIISTQQFLLFEDLAAFHFDNQYIQFQPNAQNTTSQQLQIDQMTNMTKWHCVSAAYIDSKPFSYFINPDSNLQPEHVISGENFGMIMPQANREIIVSKFGGYLREIKVWSDYINEGNILRMHRKFINTNLYYGKTLVTYLKLDESAGTIIYDYATATEFNLATLNGLLTSQNDNRISWQKPTSQLVICEGDARYSPYGYCNPRERFLKLNKEVKFGLDLQMKNSITAMWVLLNGISSSATIELTNRYKFQILPGHSRSQANYWVYIMWRINEEAQYCNYLIGKYSQEINVGDISYLGQIKEKSHQLNFKYLAQVPGTPLDFTINVENPANDILWIRSLQIWESPLSSKLIQDGLYKTPLDQKRWINQPLVLYLKFDESVGKVITNSAMAQFDRVQQFQYNDYQWVYYKELIANPYYDGELQRQFLFCQDPYTRRIDLHCDYFDQCFSFDDNILSPTYTWSSSYINLCRNPLEQNEIFCNDTTQIFDQDKNGCYDLHHKCTQGIYASNNFGCTACQPGFYLFNSSCNSECPLDSYKTQNLTCESDDLSRCVSCKNTSYLYIKSKSTCVESCPERTYYDTMLQSCEPCVDVCKTCYGPTNNNCTECVQGFLFQAATQSCKQVICQEPFQLIDEVFNIFKNHFRLMLNVNHAHFPAKLVRGDDSDLGLSFPYEPFTGGKLGGVCYEICGDGKLLGKDQCDDGNQVSGDGCSSEYKFGNKLNQEFTNAIPLAKQIIVNEEQQAKIASTADDIIRLIIFSLTSNVFLGLILGESIGPVFDAINSVQIIYYLPLIDYSFPPNLLLIFSYIGDLNLSSGDSEDPITQYFVKWKDVFDYPYNGDFFVAQIDCSLSIYIHLQIKNQAYKDKKYLHQNRQNVQIQHSFKFGIRNVPGNGFTIISKLIQKIQINDRVYKNRTWKVALSIQYELKWEKDGWIMIYLALSILGLHMSVVIVQGLFSFFLFFKSLFNKIKSRFNPMIEVKGSNLNQVKLQRIEPINKNKYRWIYLMNQKKIIYLEPRPNLLKNRTKNNCQMPRQILQENKNH